MIVRELLAVFGLKYDGRGQRQAEKGLAALRTQADMLQTVFVQALGAAALAAPFAAITKYASDAQESLNLLQVVFQDSSTSVVEWSNTTAKAMGRSRYTLRDLAAEFGGLVGAMVGPGEQAAEMSTRLAELAVDLSSLRNITEDRALVVLQSALAGETEAIKRFGVDLTVAAQEAEALRIGLGRNYKELNKSQKAQIRYNILLRDLAFVEGDAARTVDQFANSTRAARDAIKDVATELGFFFLPAAENTLKVFRNMLEPLRVSIRGFREFAENTSLAQAALIGLATIIGALLLPLIVKLVPLVLAFAAFAVVMDDVIATFRGGQSVIGEFTEYLDALEKGLPGLGSKLLRFLFWPLNRLRDVLGAVGVLLSGLFESIQSGSMTPLKQAAEGLGSALQESVTGFLKGHGESLTRGVAGAFRGAAALQGGAGIGGTIANYLDPRAALPGQGQGGGTLIQGDRNTEINIQQRPGENAEELAQRVKEVVDQSMDERDQSLYQELVSQPAGA